MPRSYAPTPRRVGGATRRASRANGPLAPCVWFEGFAGVLGLVRDAWRLLGERRSGCAKGGASSFLARVQGAIPMRTRSAMRLGDALAAPGSAWQLGRAWRRAACPFCFERTACPPRLPCGSSRGGSYEQVRFNAFWCMRCRRSVWPRSHGLCVLCAFSNLFFKFSPARPSFGEPRRLFLLGGVASCTYLP